MLVWITVIAYTMLQRGIVLAQVQSQLGATVSTLADFNELADAAGSDVAARASGSRAGVIWRALLQYPAASIWVEKDGALSAGQPPAGDPANFVHAEDARSNFVVHAAMPRIAALAPWRRSTAQNGAVLSVLSSVLLLLTYFLMRARQARAMAEREAIAAEARAAQLTLYRTQLEQTVAERTADLRQAKGQPGAGAG